MFFVLTYLRYYFIKYMIMNKSKMECMLNPLWGLFYTSPSPQAAIFLHPSSERPNS